MDGTASSAEDTEISENFRRMKQTFRDVVADGAGVIDMDHFLAVMSDMLNFSHWQVQKLLRAFRPQSDGPIECDPFFDWLITDTEFGPGIRKRLSGQDVLKDLKAGLLAAAANCDKLEVFLADSITKKSDREHLLNLASAILKHKEEHDSHQIDERRLRTIFNECDADGSGDISVGELALALDRDAQMAREYGWKPIWSGDATDIEQIFVAADEDEDGGLSWDEFYNVMCHERKVIAAKQAVHTEDQNFITHSPSILAPGSARVTEWDLDYWKMQEKDQFSLVLQALEAFGCFSELQVTVTVLRNFFMAIGQSYRDIPYHNFLHAISTVHYAFKLVEVSELSPRLLKEELFALIIGALCHDVDHRGRNTAFEVMTLSSLAMRYNDRSPLENHHCATAFDIALNAESEDKCNIFKRMESDSFRKVRQHMVSGILGTDMSFHNHQKNKLDKALEHGLDKFCDDKEFVVGLFLHTADIGNPMMSPAVADQWGRRVNEEFTAQVEEEARLGIPVTAMMSGLEDPKKAAKSKIGFIDFVITPLVTPLFILLPKLSVPKKYLQEGRESAKKQAA